MRTGLFLATLTLTGLAAAATTPPATGPLPPDAVPMTPPEEDATYSPATESTLDWLEDVEAARQQARADDPPVAPITIDAPPAGARADGIRRCIAGDGSAVFTDKACSELGATDAPPPGVADANTTRFSARTCARTRSALLEGVRDALDARDANRLASYYHWTGMGTRSAYALMDRLHGFSQKPLVDVQLVRSPEPRSTSLGEADVPPLWSPLLPAPEVGALAPRPRPPTLVRVDQMRGYKDMDAEVTFFHLTANAGCWWIHF